MSQDFIANMLVMVKNASISGYLHVDVPFSKLVLEVIKIFKNEGFLRSFRVSVKESLGMGSVRVFLRYNKDNKPVLSNVKRVSTSGCRVYKKAKDIPRIFNGFGVVVVSTSRGVVTGKVAKKELGIGGEILCYIW